MDEKLRKNVLVSSVLFMGLGHIVFLKQRLKGAFFMLIELALLAFIAFEKTANGIVLNFNGVVVKGVVGFITLGTFDPSLPVKQRPHSIFLMINGLLCILAIVTVLVVYILSVRDAQKVVAYYKMTGQKPTDRDFLHNLTDNAFPVLGLSPLLVLLALFVLLPLVFTLFIAFTNYSYPDHIPPAAKVDWVGFQNFFELFGGSAAMKMWSSALGRVLIWTVVWGVLSTACVYFGGLFMAIALQNKDIKIAPIFRAVFILPYAVPAIISTMVWANLLNGTFGPVNSILTSLGLISSNIPWLTDGTWAKFSMILVNTWAGFPYHMLMVTSIMTSISPDIYEAADIDGATRTQKTWKITLPLVMTQTMPLIIMSFTFNINNFGAAYFLFPKDSGPPAADTVSTNATSTDIVVSWIYKLTQNNPQKFQYAAVLAILVFVVLAPFAVWNYTRTKSYKESDN